MAWFFTHPSVNKNWKAKGYEHLKWYKLQNILIYNYSI